MDEKEIKKYAKIMNEFGLTGIEIKDNGNTIRLEKNNSFGNKSTGFNLNSEGILSAVEADEKEIIGNKENETDLKEIYSPIVGEFHLSYSPDNDPLVKPGDKVKKGDILCVIEAMKLMNDIVSEYDGTIVEICAINGQIVDFGFPLFKIKVENKDE